VTARILERGDQLSLRTDALSEGLRRNRPAFGVAGEKGRHRTARCQTSGKKASRRGRAAALVSNPEQSGFIRRALRRTAIDPLLQKDGPGDVDAASMIGKDPRLVQKEGSAEERAPSPTTSPVLAPSPLPGLRASPLIAGEAPSGFRRRLPFFQRPPPDAGLIFQRPQVSGERGGTKRRPASGCKLGAGGRQIEIDLGLRNDDGLSDFGANPTGLVRFASIKIAVDIPVKGAGFGA